MKNKRTSSLLAGMCVLALVALACGFNLGAPAATPTAIIVVVTATDAAPAATATEALSTATLAATGTSLPDASATPTPNGVVIKAKSNGSLGILRGTSLYYDTLGYLKNGQSSTATARNADGSWLYIPVPDYPSVSGWAYADSKYSTTIGNIKSLPVKSVDAAVPAYIRNCTSDRITIQPGSVLLQPGSGITQFIPGIYKASDLGPWATPGVGTPTPAPQALATVTLKEGVSFDLMTDGPHPMTNMTSCP